MHIRSELNPTFLPISSSASRTIVPYTLPLGLFTIQRTATTTAAAATDMMAEKDAAVDEYKRREQACQDKWEENPEVVPEECMCVEDTEAAAANPAQLSSPAEAGAQATRFGEDQASLGLDRYSVGYDLPLPPMTAAVGGDPTAVPGRASGGSKVAEAEVEGLLVETLSDLTEAGAASSSAVAAVAVATAAAIEGNRVADRNETASSPPVGSA